MMDGKKKSCLILLAFVGATCVIGVRASIENEPVRVTHQNSGPRYDIDEVERTRLSAPESPEANMVSSARQPEGDDGDQGISHVSIRRIFLVPMMPAQTADRAPASPWSLGEPSSEPARGERQYPMRPFWPFMAPHHHHMFGEDEASRPSAPSGRAEEPVRDGERESSGSNLEKAETVLRNQLDPMQMMVELLRQVLNQAIQTPLESKPPAEEELAKEASNNPVARNEKRRVEPVSAGTNPIFGASPMRPGGSNETKEDIVEIEGKKYLRKTVINRHVGENLIFMTKRLIFVPLNETNGVETTTAAAETALKTDAPVEATTTQAAPTAIPSTERPIPPNEVATSTTSAPREEEEERPQPTSTVASESPVTATTPVAPIEATSTVASEEPTREEATTPKTNPSLADAVSDIINKAAERLVNPEPVVESASSTAAPPAP